ncbi:MAG: ATP synthase F1 subunit gamma [Saprospiraceae bacterium]
MAGGLKEVRDRISSVKNTQQITKAMKMVSASKLRRAQQAIQEVRPYANKLNEMLRNILNTLEGEGGTTFGVERPIKHAVLVIVTSDRGLAGAFNTNISKLAMKRIESAPLAEAYEAGNLTILQIGKKGGDFLAKRFPKANMLRDYTKVTSNTSFENVLPVSKFLMEGFEDGTIDHVEVVYSRFRNAAMHFPEAKQFLPVAKLEVEEGASTTKADYLFEPSKEELLEYLVPTILQTTFHSYVLDVAAGEHGARMTAMDKATDNADDILRELKIRYNKARQEVITSELAEIVGGAAALEG